MPSRMHHTLNPTHRAKSNHPRWRVKRHFAPTGGWAGDQRDDSVIEIPLARLTTPSHPKKTTLARPRLQPRSCLRPTVSIQCPDMPREKISLRLPKDLLNAARGRGFPLTQLVEEGLRQRLGFSNTNGLGMDDGPTRDEFDALDARVSEIERVAQQTGAM